MSDRHIEILAELLPIFQPVKKDRTVFLTEPIMFTKEQALTAMKRVEEEKDAEYNGRCQLQESNANHFRKLYENEVVENTRLRECEAIVRELVDRPHRRGDSYPHIIDYIKVIEKAREWVEQNK